MRVPIGTPVHYVSYGTPGGEYPKTCRAALVTAIPENFVLEGTVHLVVLNPTGLFFDQMVTYDADKSGGTWHYECPMTEEEK